MTSKHSSDLGEHSAPARTEKKKEPLIHYLKIYESSKVEVEARNPQLLCAPKKVIMIVRVTHLPTAFRPKKISQGTGSRE